jgi:CDP-paratose 2-epimerase
MYDCILVTGGAGFIGSALAIALRTRYPSTSVVALDSLRRRGSELNLPRLREAGVAFVHGDVRCLEDLLALEPAPNLIIEASAEPSAQAGYGQSPEYVINTNLLGCANCLELARRARSDFIFLSSSRVYPHALVNQLAFHEDNTRFQLDSQQSLPGASAFGISEDFLLEGARTMYGATKLSSELLIHEYADMYGLRCLIDRCSLITGPGQMAKTDQGVFALWMAAHFFRRPLRFIGFGGEGKQVRDFLHVDDLVDLVTMQIEAIDRNAGKVFNVGGGPDFSLSLLECTQVCREITGNTIPVEHDPKTRAGDVRIFLTDRRKISAVADWRPTRSATATLASIYDWIRREESHLKDVLLPSC